MRLRILGNNGPFAADGGACSSYLISGDYNIVCDMGPGSLANLQKAIDIRDIDAIIFSHLHYDHCSDVFSLKYALGLLRQREGFDKKIKLFLPDSPSAIAKEIADEPSFDTYYIHDGLKAYIKGLDINFCEMTHPVESYAVAFSDNGRRLVYSGDTTLNDKIADFCKNADICLMDGGLMERHSGGPHLTVSQACKAADGKILLTHISPLYDAEELNGEIIGDAAFVKIGDIYEL